MSLVNAVHALLEVAAGRRNLSAAEADQLHDEIDAPAVTPDPSPPAGSPSDASAPADSTAPSTPTEGVNLDAPADA